MLANVSFLDWLKRLRKQRKEDKWLSTLNKKAFVKGNSLHRIKKEQNEKTLGVIPRNTCLKMQTDLLTYSPLSGAYIYGSPGSVITF